MTSHLASNIDTYAEHGGYPPEDCAFCPYNVAFPYIGPASHDQSPVAPISLDSIPADGDASRPDRLSPEGFIVLAAPNVLAFLDIQPLTRGHILVAPRAHRTKTTDMESSEIMELAQWLPLISRTLCNVLGVTDYNICQNNGPLAAQVVPHVHFHVVPRGDSSEVPQGVVKTSVTFTRGRRMDLEDEEGAQMASELRQGLRREVQEYLERKEGKREKSQRERL